MRKIAPWMQTYSGKKVWLNDFKMKDICIEDIAHALSMICRFNGHTKRFYSVAEHCYLATHLVPKKYKMATLMHDASEAYLGDVHKPLKDYQNGRYAALEIRFERTIRRRFKILNNRRTKSNVKEADLMMLRAEAEQALNRTPIESWHGDLPDNELTTIQFFCPSRARDMFLMKFNELTR